MYQEVIKRVNLSLGRCLIKDEFLNSFYERLLSKNPQIEAMFQKTDLKKQIKVLREGITFLVMASGGSRFAIKELEKLGILHDKDHLNIAPSMYSIWVDAFLSTLEEYDYEFNEKLGEEWRTTLEESLTVMKEAY